MNSKKNRSTSTGGNIKFLKRKSGEIGIQVNSNGKNPEGMEDPLDEETQSVLSHCSRADSTGFQGKMRLARENVEIPDFESAIAQLTTHGKRD